MRKSPFKNHAPQIPVGGYVVESVIVHRDMSQVGCHLFDRVLPPNFEELFVVCCVELQQCGAELESLRPFCPPACGILTGGGEHRRPFEGSHVSSIARIFFPESSNRCSSFGLSCSTVIESLICIVVVCPIRVYGRSDEKPIPFLHALILNRYYSSDGSLRTQDTAATETLSDGTWTKHREVDQ